MVERGGAVCPRQTHGAPKPIGHSQVSTLGEVQKNNEKVKVADMAVAITQASGVKAAAARLVHVSWWTVNNYIKKYPTCKLAYDAATSEITDIARANVIQAIRSGDVAESKWWLTKKDPEFRDVTRQEITGSDGGPVEISIVELAKLAARYDADGRGDQRDGASRLK